MHLFSRVPASSCCFWIHVQFSYLLKLVTSRCQEKCISKANSLTASTDILLSYHYSNRRTWAKMRAPEKELQRDYYFKDLFLLLKLHTWSSCTMTHWKSCFATFVIRVWENSHTFVDYQQYCLGFVQFLLVSIPGSLILFLYHAIQQMYHMFIYRTCL